MSTIVLSYPDEAYRMRTMSEVGRVQVRISSPQYQQPGFPIPLVLFLRRPNLILNSRTPFELSVMTPRQFAPHGTFSCATNWIVLDSNNPNDSEESASEEEDDDESEDGEEVEDQDDEDDQHEHAPSDEEGFSTEV